MIEWVRVDKSNPPYGRTLLFYYKGMLLIGCPLRLSADGEGYPIWETTMGTMGIYSGIRYYSTINDPEN